MLVKELIHEITRGRTKNPHNEARLCTLNNALFYCHGNGSLSSRLGEQGSPLPLLFLFFFFPLSLSFSDAILGDNEFTVKLFPARQMDPACWNYNMNRAPTFSRKIGGKEGERHFWLLKQHTAFTYSRTVQRAIWQVSE